MENTFLIQPNENIKIGFSKTHPLAKNPKIAYAGTSAGWDVFAVEETFIPAGGSAIVPIGIKFTIPKGYRIDAHDCSGNGIIQGLQAHQGIFDMGYSYDWAIKLFNLSDQNITVGVGDKVVQFVLTKIPEFELVEMDQEEWNKYEQDPLNVRGPNGQGSTGVIGSK